MKKELESIFETYLGMSTGQVSRVVANELGIDTLFQVEKHEYRYHKGEIFFSLVEAEGHNETDKAFRNNAALRQLFSSVKMVITCGYDEISNSGRFVVEVEYNHNYGKGSNGHSLMSFWIDFNSGEVTDIVK